MELGIPMKLETPMGLGTHTDYPMGAWDINGVEDTPFVLWGCQWRSQSTGTQQFRAHGIGFFV